jgi:Fis family transcriptional regulator, factor for inversion stimulation protein
MTPAMRFDMGQLVTKMRDAGVSYEEAVREFKKQFLREILVANKGNQCTAAAEMGAHRNTISRNMQELGLSIMEVRASIRPPRPRRVPPVVSEAGA